MPNLTKALLRGLACALVGVSLLAAPSALAKKEAGHGDEAAHHDDDHGGAHHADYVGDKDHDGTPNWLDSKNDVNPDDPNEEFVLYDLLFHAFNLLFLFAIVGYFGRRPVADAVRSRALGIRQELVDTARERDEAKERYDELEARLAQFEDEVKRMKRDAEVEAKAEEERTIANAKIAAERVAEIAERNIRDEVQRARITLRHEAVDLAVQLAEQTLRAELEQDDHRRLAREFLQSLNEEVVGHG